MTETLGSSFIGFIVIVLVTSPALKAEVPQLVEVVAVPPEEPVVPSHALNLMVAVP